MSAALALGTAQLGIPGYGVSGPGGAMPRATALALLARARELGFAALDTAPHYGDAETLVGEHRGELGGSVRGAASRATGATSEAAVRVASGRSSAADCESALALLARTPAYLARLGSAGAARAVREGLERSLARLRAERVQALLVHVTEDLLGDAGPAAWGELERARADGRAEAIGAVAYGQDELERLLARYPLEVVQVPLSILDQRLVASGALARLAERGVRVHGRSVLLQGLLLMDPDELPRGLERAREPLARFRAFAAARGLAPLEAALGWALARPELELVAVGAHSLQELEQLAAASATRVAEAPELACADALVVDPARWPNAAVGAGR